MILPPPDPCEPVLPDEDRVFQAIAASVRKVIVARGPRPWLRDVHPKHHGCVWAELQVLTGLSGALQHGVFGTPGRTYKAWVRFSNGNKRVQPDAIGDSRGMAIKLLEVDGVRLVEHPPERPSRSQDFILSTHPVFFVRDARDMVEVAALEARDGFPGRFFGQPDRLAGLAALLATGAIKAASPLSLEYYSQTPYRLGPLIVKLRAVPVSERNDYDPSAPELQDQHYLRRALARRLGQREDVVFELQAQLQAEDDPIDDATIPWRGPFEPLARLHIPSQQFEDADGLSFAERIAFNPWNGVTEHRPLGSLNRARFGAYRASSQTRRDEDVPPEPEYTVQEWEARKARKVGDAIVPPKLPQLPASFRALKLVSTIFPELSRGLLALLKGRWRYAPSTALFAAIVAVGLFRPIWFTAPLSLGPQLPSDALIPPAKYSARYAGTAFERSESVRRSDLRWAFRYAPTGSELLGGTPYWVFRALPRMFPQRFDYRGDWSLFGLRKADDDEYYTDYHGLPRGAVLSDTTVHVGGNTLSLRLKRVSFNCATCHRGEYTGDDGKPHFVDGMPNLGIDTAGFKRVNFDCLNDPHFTAESLVKTIDQLLLEDHARAHPESRTPPPRLSLFERGVYVALVAALKNEAQKKPLGWMKDHVTRPANGFGRLDAFSALRFEVMKLPYQEDKSLATVDLPSIWHQSTRWRKRHHYDGNTRDERARNFGAIVGVGGASYSIDRAQVDALGHWIDEVLEPTAYPFAHRPTGADAAAGKALYLKHCARCHGQYEAGQLTEMPACMSDPPSFVDMGTDPLRAEAADAEFIDKLNELGTEHGLWSTDSFMATGKYACPPLDGIWARAPYLHNGSVPTLEHLLLPAAQRPAKFRRGNPGYDTEKGGFVWELDEKPADGRDTSELDTSLRGNGNGGHNVVLAEEAERKNLVAYLLTL